MKALTEGDYIPSQEQSQRSQMNTRTFSITVSVDREIFVEDRLWKCTFSSERGLIRSTDSLFRACSQKKCQTKEYGSSSIQQETHTEIDILFPGDPKEAQVRAVELADRKLISYFFAGKSCTVDRRMKKTKSKLIIYAMKQGCLTST